MKCYKVVVNLLSTAWVLSSLCNVCGDTTDMPAFFQKTIFMNMSDQYEPFDGKPNQELASLKGQWISCIKVL